EAVNFARSSVTYIQSMRSGMNKAAVLLLIVGVFSVSVPMFAHHGTNISYDRSKPATMQGTVTEFRFANPHPQLFVDVKDGSGNVSNWGCEIAAKPYPLQLSCLTKP